MNEKNKGLTYAEAGVDIQAGEEVVRRIKTLAKNTFNDQVLSEIGSFGGFFKPNLKGMKSPVLIASADGVGTKLKLAFLSGRHNTVGEDLVNHCTNDILVHAARSLFFLDYIGTGKVEPGVVEQIVEGFARGCKNSGAALLGGETAEMPDFYAPGEYDLAGFIVGLVDQDRVVNGSTIKVGDVCVGLASNGLHTNGYTLARKAVFELGGLKIGSHVDELGMTIDESLMLVHTCYAKIVHELTPNFDLHGMAHITGGGLPGNLNRILPEGTEAQIKKGSWPILPIFGLLQRLGSLDPDDMYRAFNMGIGYVLVLPADQADRVVETINKSAFKAYQIGEIKPGTGQVRLVD